LLLCLELTITAIDANIKWGCKGIIFIIESSGGGRGRIQAPSSCQWLGHLSRLTKLQRTGLLGHNGALVFGLQLRHKLGDKAADLLGVQVTNFLGDINEGGDDLVVALFLALLKGTASSADLNRELFTGGVTDKLARLLLNILRGTRGFINSPTLFRALTVAHLLGGTVALAYCLIIGLLLEGDLALLLKVLLAHLLLGWGELCDVGVVALLNILVGTF